MKTLLPLCLSVVFVGIASVSAQVPAGPHPHSLSLQAELASAGGGVQDTDSSHSHYGYVLGGGIVDKVKSKETETTKESETVQITVRNLSPLPDTAQVEWYFVAAPVKPKSGTPFAEQETIFDGGAQSVTLAPSATVTIPAESKDITSKLKRHTQGHVHKGKAKRDANWESDKGLAMKGWMVRLVADGKLLDSRASSDELSDIVKDDAKFSVLKQQ